jgi:prolyl oligopeptidase
MTFTYPAARRSDHVDDYHGTLVADPYRWLEDPEAPETRAFVRAQNDVTLPYLASLPEVDRLRPRIAELWDTPRTGAPVHRNGVVVWQHNDGIQDQPVFYVSRNGCEPEAILDPNTLSDDGAVAVVVWSLSPDGSLLAYTVSEAGSDRQVARIRDTVTGEDRTDELHHLRFTTLAWWRDGLFYARFPERPEGDVGLFLDMSVHYHRLGTSQDEDALVFSNPERPDLGYAPEVSDDRAYLVLTEYDGTSNENGLLYKPLGDPGAPMTRIVPTGVASHRFLAHHGGRFLVETNLDAPNGRVVAIPLDAADERLELIAEGPMPIEIAAAAAGRVAVVALDEAAHTVSLYRLDGSPDGQIRLPAPGSVAEISGHLDDPAIYLGYQSFLHPPTALRWENGASTTFAGAAPPIDPGRVIVERRHAVADDGTRIGMHVVRLADTPLPAPTELYGYGGFNINLTPMYAPARLAWLEAGGVVAVANLRGGSEHGEEWHRQGMLGSKQRVFDDFAACAEHLVAEGVATRERLGIRGGSNGGLLATAVMLQRPDLFGAVIAQVPVTDMFRYQHFTAGRYWTVEYGDAARDPEAFRWLSGYSPLHNLRQGVRYPPLLLLTAESDDRVVPMHALKFAAAVQHAAGGASTEPLLVRVETRAGHGLGKPTSKLIDEAADVYGFLLHHLTRRTGSGRRPPRRSGERDATGQGPR